METDHRPNHREIHHTNRLRWQQDEWMSEHHRVAAGQWRWKRTSTPFPGPAPKASLSLPLRASPGSPQEHELWGGRRPGFLLCLRRPRTPVRDLRGRSPALPGRAGRRTLICIVPPGFHGPRRNPVDEETHVLGFFGSSGTSAVPFLPLRPASLLRRDAPAIPGDLTLRLTGRRSTRRPARTSAPARVCAVVLEGLVVLIVVGMYLRPARLRRA